MDHLFTTLSRAVEGSAGVALGASFLWGVLSVVLSPCHLSSIPLIVGFISGQGKLTRGRALAVSSLFALGILITIAVVGVVTASLGRMLGDVGRVGNYLVAAVFFLVGSVLLDLVPVPLSGVSGSGLKRRGPLAALVLGLLFGIALGPCTFAFMAPVLAVTFATGAKSLIFGAAMLAAYGIGHCLVIVFAGASAGAVQRFLNWNEGSRGALILKRICGVLVIAGGIYMIWNAR